MNLQKNRSQISRVNNAQGKNFENQIMSACLGYLYEGRACIDKIPEPFGVSKKDQQTGMFKGRFLAIRKHSQIFKGHLKVENLLFLKQRQQRKIKYH